MRILFPVSEAAPLYKVGGLGDVAGALPKALRKLGHDVRVIIPKHPEIILDSSWKVAERFTVIYNNLPRLIQIWSGYLPDTDVKAYVVAEGSLISKHSGASDAEVDKFALFSLAVAQWVVKRLGGWSPQVIHVHDWHVALIPLLLKNKFKDQSFPTLITIHNLRYQGKASVFLSQKLGLQPGDCQILAWDQANGDIDILMEGILHADYINAVSPTYAKEILTQEYGAGLEHVLEARKGRLSGILNGIDTEVWNPETDTYLLQKYTFNTWRDGKTTNKLAIQKAMGLPVDANVPLLGFVGRIDEGQKGIDLIISAIKEQRLLPEPRQMVFLGVGNPDLEGQLKALSHERPNFKAAIRYDEALAHMIYAGADVMLIPSLYEPCGLVQLIGMRYGAIPVARKTGGLADTVIEGQTGFIFGDYSWTGLADATDRALKLLEDQVACGALVKSIMEKDLGWDPAAHEYVNLYTRMVAGG